MGEVTGIEWTDATVNFWWGCTKVSPGCDNCYAEAWNNFRGNGEWGAGAPRRKIKSAAATMRSLNRQAPAFQAEHGRRRRVFVQSMSDIADNEVDEAWRHEMHNEVEAADGLDVQLLTKRIGNIQKQVPDHWKTGGWPRHVGLMISVVNQEEADRDIPKLIELKRRFGIPWIGISVEPMLELIEISKYLRNLDWVIVGGESGRKGVGRYIQPLHPDWVRSLRDQCAAAGVAFFFKQWGEWAVVYDRDRDDPEWRRCPSAEDSTERYVNLAGGHGFHGERVVFMRRVGKKRAGALLDGREHREFPTVAELHQAVA